jgi:hypothetical protein
MLEEKGLFKKEKSKSYKSKSSLAHMNAFVSLAFFFVKK